MLDDKLQEILDKHNIVNENKTKKIITNIFLSLKEKNCDKIAFYGGGKHTEHLLEIAQDYYGFVYVIDRNQPEIKTRCQYEYIKIDELEQKEIKAVIISSYGYRKEMYEELEKYIKDSSILVVDIYDYFKSQGYTVDYCYYTGYTYEDIFYTKQNYLNTSDNQQRKTYLKKLIEQYLDIRDLLYAQKYINEYIECGYDIDGNYKELLNDLTELQKNIKDKISEKKYSNIIVNLLDSLNPEFLEDMSFLKAEKKKSIYFENAFTVIPWTRHTLATMLTGKLNIDDELWKETEFDENNSIMLKYLKEHDYKLVYIGLDKFCNDFFTSDNVEAVQGKFELDCITRYQWYLLSELYEQKQKCVFIVHGILETHNPFVSGDISALVNGDYGSYPDYDYFFEKNKKTIYESRQYIDRQLEYYSNYYKNQIPIIYTSDHSCCILAKPEKNLRALLMVRMPDMYEGKIIHDLYSHTNFIYILKYIIECDKKYLDLSVGKYVKMQSIDIYNKTNLDELLHDEEKYMNYLQFRAIQTEKDKLVEYADGRIKYYILPDIDTDLSNEEIYAERIKQLEKLMGDKYVDIWKEDKFKYTRKLYEKFNIKCKYKTEKTN